MPKKEQNYLVNKKTPNIEDFMQASLKKIWYTFDQTFVTNVVVRPSMKKVIAMYHSSMKIMVIIWSNDMTNGNIFLRPGWGGTLLTLSFIWV